MVVLSQARETGGKVVVSMVNGRSLATLSRVLMPRYFLAAACIIGSCFSTAAFGINFYYNIDRPQPLVDCDQLAYTGDIEGSLNCYSGVLQNTNERTATAVSYTHLTLPTTPYV